MSPTLPPCSFCLFVALRPELYNDETKEAASLARAAAGRQPRGRRTPLVREFKSIRTVISKTIIFYDDFEFSECQT